MPRNKLEIRPLRHGINSVEDLVQEINQKMIEINESFQKLELLESQVRGEDGFTAQISSNLNMSSKRITNGARSKSPDDFVIRRELEELLPGLFSPGRPIEVNSQLNIKKGISIGGSGGSSSNVLNEGDVVNLINSAIGDNVPTIKDGQVVDLEDTDGTDGSTTGTLLFATTVDNGVVKARPVRITPAGDILTSNPRLEELIESLNSNIDRLIDRLS